MATATDTAVGFLPRDFVGPARATPRDYLTYVGWCRSTRERRITATHVEEALDAVGLQDRSQSRICALSGGMVRRLGIAQALLGSAPVLVRNLMVPLPTVEQVEAGTTAIVIGGGPAGLIAAEVLARAGVVVTVSDRMPSVARKFLLAGHGGLNITHSEARDTMLTRYGTSADRLAPMLATFGPADLRAWCADLGEPTFVGSSGRVFPGSFRATPLVRAWLARLRELGVTIETRQRWTGWAGPGGELSFTGVDGGTRDAAADVVIFALGGASWPRLGADGGWVGPFTERGVAVTPLRAANVGVRVTWSEPFAERFTGAPLKQVGLSVRGGDAARGDAMVTRTGLEGGPVYAIGTAIREALDVGGRCAIDVDLRPDLTADQLTQRLARRRPKESGSTWLRRAVGLDPAAIALVREVSGGALPNDPAVMAGLIKAVPVAVTGTMPIERAISTAGGIAWTEVDERLMLHRLTGTFVAGEMLDWEAPTGGYLLQASFSTGVVAALGALERLRGDAAR